MELLDSGETQEKDIPLNGGGATTTTLPRNTRMKGKRFLDERRRMEFIMKPAEELQTPGEKFVQALRFPSLRIVFTFISVFTLVVAVAVMIVFTIVRGNK